MNDLPPITTSVAQMTTKERVATAEQAILELAHCVLSGADWFTRGKSGQLSHCYLWSERGLEAIRALAAEVIEP